MQESLTNPIRHAEAQGVEVTASFADHHLVLTVSDDGTGLRPGPPHGVDRGSAPGRAGLGLLGVRQRVAAAGGAVEITTTPGNGTTLLARLPVPHPTADDVTTAATGAEDHALHTRERPSRT